MPPPLGSPHSFNLHEGFGKYAFRPPIDVAVLIELDLADYTAVSEVLHEHDRDLIGTKPFSDSSSNAQYERFRMCFDEDSPMRFVCGRK
jgi:hypothetical protein